MAYSEESEQIKAEHLLGKEMANRLRAAAGGLQSYGDIVALYALGELVSGDSASNIVEVGTGAGISGATLLLAAPKATLLTIDSYATPAIYPASCTRQRAEKLYADLGLTQRVTHCQMPSDEAAQRIPLESADLVWIDGNHDYEQVMRDIVNYWPRVRIGGYLSGHDYAACTPGVVRAVSEWNRTEPLFRFEKSSVFFVRKRKGQQ